MPWRNISKEKRRHPCEAELLMAHRTDNTSGLGISTDLTFVTNEQGRSLADRFRVLLGQNTRAFDCLVGYFYLSGFKRLAESLGPTEKIRVLIGLSTDRPT